MAVLWKWRAVAPQHDAFLSFRLKASHSWEDTPVLSQYNANKYVVLVLWCGWEVVVHSFKRNALKIKEGRAELWEEGILYVIWILLVVKSSKGCQVTPGSQPQLCHWLWPGASSLTYLCLCDLFSNMIVVPVSRSKCKHAMKWCMYHFTDTTHCMYLINTQ